MLVRELMSTDVVTVDEAATLADAAERLLANGVGSVIVVDSDGAPVGILTETDLVRAGYETGRPFADVDVGQIGHRPVITTKPSASISRVAGRMTEEGVKKVPVMDDLELVGILTYSDIVNHLSTIRREASDLAAAREEWESEE